MRTKLRLEIAAFMLAGTWSATATAATVTLVRDEASLSPADVTRVLYRHGGVTVLRDVDAQNADFEDVYAVNTYNYFATPEFFDDAGEVLAFSPGNFAVMRLSPRAAANVSARLHGLGLACGVLTKLDGDPVATEMRATPTPILPIDVRDVRVERVTALVEPDRIRATIADMVAMTTRYHQSTNGQGVADALAAKYRALADGRADVTVSTYDHGAATPQKSLLVRITGRTRPTEVIVLGSHIDSINMPWSFLNPAHAAPGADDNASGTATNLEIFRLLMEQGVELDRTLEIHGYAAEEIGLVGSADMAKDYKDQGVNVVAMVQLDMTAFKASGAPDQIWFVSDNTDSGFNALLGRLVNGYTGMSFGQASLPQGSSDHASWTSKGFAASFPFENPAAHNGHIHTSDDTLGNATAFTLAAGFAKLGIAYVMHFGGVN